MQHFLAKVGEHVTLGSDLLELRRKGQIVEMEGEGDAVAGAFDKVEVDIAAGVDDPGAQAAIAGKRKDDALVTDAECQRRRARVVLDGEYGD